MAKRSNNAVKTRVTGEITCTAESGGRLITLDPIKQHKLTVMLNEVESTLPCGFRCQWMHGDKDGKEFDMACGAGVGSKWITFTYLGKQCTIDGRQLLEAAMAAIEKECGV